MTSPWTESLTVNLLSPFCSTYSPESFNRSDVMVRDVCFSVKFTITLSFHSSNNVEFPEKNSTMSELLNIQAPVLTESWMESVTLLPTGVGFLVACKFWLYTGARKKKKEQTKNKQYSPLSMTQNILLSKMISFAKSPWSVLITQRFLLVIITCFKCDLCHKQEKHGRQHFSNSVPYR